MDDEDEYDTSAGAGAAGSEATPLLHNTDLPPDVAPDKAFRRKVVAMCVLAVFIVEVSVFIMDPPAQQIMESIICRDHYPDHLLSLPSVEDDRCKGKDVQKTLAMVRSWSLSAEMAVRECLIGTLWASYLSDSVQRCLFRSRTASSLTSTGAEPSCSCPSWDCFSARRGS